MASSAEREIRDALVSWWHSHEPSGRVVHELPLSGFSAAGRADLGVIFPDAIVLIEIKSERDKLTRLKDQFQAMSARSHDFFAVMHEKWIDGKGEVADQSWMNWAHREHVWRYPEAGAAWRFDRYQWSSRTTPPNPYMLLGMLWADELRGVYGHAGVMGLGGKLGIHSMINDLGQRLTGRQVTRAVCAALRSRTFAEADPAIDEVPEGRG